MPRPTARRRDNQSASYKDRCPPVAVQFVANMASEEVDFSISILEKYAYLFADDDGSVLDYEYESDQDDLHSEGDESSMIFPSMDADEEKDIDLLTEAFEKLTIDEASPTTLVVRNGPPKKKRRLD